MRLQRDAYNQSILAIINTLCPSLAVQHTGGAATEGWGEGGEMGGGVGVEGEQSSAHYPSFFLSSAGGWR